MFSISTLWGSAALLLGVPHMLPSVRDSRQGPVHAHRSVADTRASRGSSPVGPGSIAAGVVSGVMGRVTLRGHQGVDAVPFQNTVGMVGTLRFERGGCRGGIVDRPSAQFLRLAEGGGRTRGFDAGGQAAGSQRARIGTAKSPPPKPVQTSPS